ncbi:MAG: hypothetical protein IJB02_04365 [Oscillospiraceae bacterium]|nr:hypothetical protein [Oscillospiraceae bacterium]MBQ7000251.1 hypothetical protein [Oscillospiraceae bacterium]
MADLTKLIAKASADEISGIWQPLLNRYKELFPDWDITILTIEKTQDRNKQIDNLIHIMESLRTAEE